MESAKFELILFVQEYFQVYNGVPSRSDADQSKDYSCPRCSTYCFKIQFSDTTKTPPKTNNHYHSPKQPNIPQKAAKKIHLTLDE